MTELDQIWSQMLDQAAARARDSGSHEVAAYLKLKATNDAIRAVGVGWLFETVIEIAAEITRPNPKFSIEREDPHRFEHGSSKLVGMVLHVRHGLRCLTVEAGWTRTPSDGIMRGGALAFAHVSHFGMPKSGAELMLVADTEKPRWCLVETREPLDSNHLRRHFEILTT